MAVFSTGRFATAQAPFATGQKVFLQNLKVMQRLGAPEVLHAQTLDPKLPPGSLIRFSRSARPLWGFHTTKPLIRVGRLVMNDSNR